VAVSPLESPLWLLSASASGRIPLQNSMASTADLVGGFPLERVCGIGTNPPTRLRRASSGRRRWARAEKLSEPL
jgi:hypothetical protein